MPIDETKDARWQSDLLGCHKGHITMVLDSCDLYPLNEEIKKLSTVDRTEMFNQNSGIMVSIKDSGDAFEAMKGVGKLLRDGKYITHDESLHLHRELGLTSSPHRGGENSQGF